ncbi:hypothetical protein ACQPW1_30900 [Nocardia sp. CA-128927]|uniref:hypothetical protein n=1 Tax=Nocardia sp. CA-128927 TaxID=3239975 RepID=UPI003D95A747
MSTEYERTVHSDKSTEDVPTSEQESSWQGDRDETESERVADENAADHTSTTTDDGEAERATDLDVEPEHVSTTEYGTEQEHATATEYSAEPERATSANAGAGSATTADYEAQPAETTTADYDYDAQPTATSDVEVDQAAGDTEADQVVPVAAPEQSTTAGNGAERQQTSLDDVGAPLFVDTDLDRLRTQWREVQGTFVDNPRDAVTQADQIVTDVIYQLTTAIAERKRVLEERTSGATDSDTEDLRQALRGYRGFFRRLLSIES